MSSLCIVHGWSHSTEPCPYCREINASRHSPRRATHRHRPASVVPPEPSDEARADILSQAIVASISGDTSQVTELFTHDVTGSGPAISISSREELAGELEERVGSFTDVEIALAPLEVSGEQACVEWVATAVHSGPLVVDESRTGVLGPTGRRVRVRAITVAEFDGNQICSFRSYWDDVPVFRELREAQPG
ncbi:MAG: nuclear transport factor 2 family protein [Acidimicrobiia bacterium]